MKAAGQDVDVVQPVLCTVVDAEAKKWFREGEKMFF